LIKLFLQSLGARSAYLSIALVALVMVGACATSAPPPDDAPAVGDGADAVIEEPATPAPNDMNPDNMNDMNMVDMETPTTPLDNIAPTMPPDAIEPATPPPAIVETPAIQIPPTEFGELKFVENSDCEPLGVRERFLPSQRVTITYETQTLYALAELADENDLRTQGLMCRENVGAGEGMLFTFNNHPQTGNFWMYNTYAPLDIIYIDSDNNSADSVKTMAPCPRNGMGDSEWCNKCKMIARANYQPRGSYIAALELPAGWLSQNGLDLFALNTDELKKVKIAWERVDG